MGQKLTTWQIEALALIADSRFGEMQGSYLREVYHVNRRTLDSLWRHNLLSTGANASGPYWSITEAGRAALSSASKPGER